MSDRPRQVGFGPAARPLHDQAHAAVRDALREHRGTYLVVLKKSETLELHVGILERIETSEVVDPAAAGVPTVAFLFQALDAIHGYLHEWLTGGTS